MIKLVVSFLFIYFGMHFLLPGAVSANHFVTQSTVKCRPLAMGGAFSAVNDNLAAFSYNPATFKQYRAKKDFRLTFFLNPLGSFVSFFEQDASDSWEGIGKSLGFLFKSITFSSRYLEGGLFFAEEAVQNYRFNEREKFFSSQGFWDNFSHRIGLRLALAQQVAIGMATTFYFSRALEGEQWRIGNSYGVLLNPDQKYSVGVFYIAFPEDFARMRTELERLVNDTVNIGLAYQPLEKTTLALDIRNINSEDNINSREIHVGAEQLLGSVLALRAGYFRERRQKHVISGGIGLLSDNFLFKKNKHFHPPRFLFDYTLVLERKKTTNSMWHFFSLSFRF